MAQSSILGGSKAALEPRGTGARSLGPSDSSDSGSDIQGETTLVTDHLDNPSAQPGQHVRHGSDSDAAGTGERADVNYADVEDGADIAPDHIRGQNGSLAAASAMNLETDPDEVDPDTPAEDDVPDPAEGSIPH